MILTDARTIETKRKIQAAVEAGLKARNISARRASLDVVGNDGLIRDIRAGVMPAVDRLEALMDYLGLGFQFGATSAPVLIEHITLAGSDYARIPVHDARLSAGPGEMNDGVAIIDHMAFRQDWLRKIDVKPENALIARVAGDSMAPAIQSGDLVMIDKTRRDVPAFKKTRLPQQLPIFAFRQDDQARVKRLERRVKEKLLILYSDNPTLPAEVIGEGDVQSLEILGQVVWSGHVWR
jgi:hypothetical protein